MPFNFEGIGKPFVAEEYRRFVSEFQGFLNQDEHMPVYCFGNHDQPRMATRVGAEQARVIAVMQLGLPGLPVIYYGDEIGMKNGVIKPEEEQDPLNRINPGKKVGRDGERTPMQWDPSPSAGFSTAKPWLPIAAHVRTHNVRQQLPDKSSYLSLYRHLLHMRDTYDIFQQGDYESSTDTHPDIYAFGRRLGDQHVFVVLNFSKKKRTFQLPHGGRVLVSSQPTDHPTIDKHGTLKLRGYEAAIVECAHHPLKPRD
jgi:alpha-glucosidase